MATIRERLAILREMKIETFGSSTHELVLNAPLSEADVRALEVGHGVSLPEAYRAFLLEEGASGAGPYYGLVPPDRWGDALMGDVAMPDFAARPCLWTPGGTETWDAVQEANAEPFQGAIVIADQGCAYYAMLVTAGAARGRVMYVSLEGGKPRFVEDRDFRAWYERWLDELLMDFDHSWFGLAMPGTPESFAAIAGEATHPRRHDALAAMFQLRTLSAEGKAAIASCVRDDDARLRATALSLVKKFELGSIVESDLRAALDAGDPQVRVRALEALVAATASWQDDARRLLDDPDDAVVSTALRQLDKAKATREDDILRVLEAKRSGAYSTAQQAARTIPSVRIFDVVLGHVAEGDTKHGERMQTLVAQARMDVLDVARLAALLDVAMATIAKAPGPDTPGGTLAALRILATQTRKVEDAAIVTRAFDALVGVLKHREPYFRFDAAAHLGELGNRAALPALREIVDDPAMPRGTSSSTAFSVGENAKRAIAKIEAKQSNQPA